MNVNFNYHKIFYILSLLMITACNQNIETIEAKDVISVEEPTEDECHNVYILADAVMQIRMKGAKLEDIVKSTNDSLSTDTGNLLKDIAYDAYSIQIPETNTEQQEVLNIFKNKWKESCTRK